MVMSHGVGNVKWSVIAAQLHGRIGKQCRERWFNHLDPAIKKGEWTEVEDHVVFEAQLVFGNRWSEIAKLLPGRTENAVKNRFNSSARKKWLTTQASEKQMMKATGIVKNPDPVEIKRVYKLAENLFLEAAKERARMQVSSVASGGRLRATRSRVRSRVRLRVGPYVLSRPHSALLSFPCSPRLPH